jgi:hypothetical protein
MYTGESMGRILVYNFYEQELSLGRMGGGQLIAPPAYNRFETCLLLSCSLF